MSNGSQNPDWDRTYSHLQKGLDNGQQTVRAMDTKTSILTGLSIFALGAVAGLVKVFCDLVIKSPDAAKALLTLNFAAHLILVLFAISVIIAVVLGVCCVIACLGTLVARGRKKPQGAPQTTVLFPWVHPENEKEEREKDIAHYEDVIIGGKIDEELVREEYYDQIVNVGHIIWQKIAHNGKAVKWFRRQAVATGVSILLLVPALFAFSYLCQKTVKPTPKQPAPPVAAPAPPAPAVPPKAPSPPAP